MIEALEQSVQTLQSIINGFFKTTPVHILILNDLTNSNLSIQYACEVMGSLIDNLEKGMNEHEHFDGYIEEHIHQARWVISKIFEETNLIHQAIQASKVKQ